MNNIYAIFHLNLAYSSVSIEQRLDIINRCYWPLLKLIEVNNIPLGIELSGWTLQTIKQLDNNWIANFKNLLANKKCELIGSGYCQTIGPLIPYEVNQWNQKLGREDYYKILGVNPDIALVNELAYSSGLVSVYREAGYKGIIIDHDNVSLTLNMDKKESRLPFYADGEDGNILPVLWSDSILFQKLQRYVHGDISKRDYLDYLDKRKNTTTEALCLYCNDAEIVDYRPGRYSTELALNEEPEWIRVQNLFNYLFYTADVHWCLPSTILHIQQKSREMDSGIFSSITQPIPVKKQLKYNVSRWAITGKNDLWINTMCYRIYKGIISGQTKNDKQYWRKLLECWSSDLRTHITKLRWKQANLKIKELISELNLSDKYRSIDVGDHQSIHIDSLLSKGYMVESINDGLLLRVKTNSVDVQFNIRRGMSVYSLAFAQHSFVSIIGTLSQGYFDSIELGADFYSCAVVIDLIKQHHRISDLQSGVQNLYVVGDELCVQIEIQTELGTIVKQYFIHPEKEQLRLKISFPNWKKPYGSLRAGTLTLLPSAFNEELYIQCKMGGSSVQNLFLNQDCTHHKPISNIVSCTTGIGATEGQLTIGDNSRRLCVKWDPSQCAVFPMIYHTVHSPTSLTRIYFSLCELDETFTEGGMLPAFEYVLSPV